MISRDIKSPDDPGFLERLTSTVNRCHVLGAVAATALIVGIGWISSFRSDVAEIDCGGTLVNLNDARALIENADQWRRQYTIEYTRSREVDKLANSISLWLPRAVDEQRVEQGVRAFGDQTETTILSYERGDQHIGKRVGVATATCTVQTTYRSLCEFLNALSQRPQPIACSEIRIHRVITDEGSVSQSTETTCTATLSLRIPFAGKGTAAGRLLAAETKNAS